MTRGMRGQTLPIYIFILALVITLAVASSRLARSMVHGVKEKKSLTALQLAQAGINHGYHWLREDPSRWAALSATSQTFNPTGLSGQGPLTSLQVDLLQGSVSSQRLIRATGKILKPGAPQGDEVRRLEAVLEDQIDVGPLWVSGGASLGGSSVVHWGRVISKGDVVITGAAANNRYPRKFARGRIILSGIEQAADGVEFFPYSGEVPDMPALDLAWYRAQALGQSDAATLAQGTRSGNVFTPAGGQVKFTVNDDGPPSDPAVAMGTSGDDRVRYVEGDLQITGSGYLRGALIVLGDLTLAGTAAGKYHVPVPAQAKDEYAKVETAAPNEYPGDQGSTANPAFKFGNPGSPPTFDQGGTSQAVSINGFIYVTGSIKATGNPLIHGAVWSGGAGNSGSVVVYYRGAGPAIRAANGEGVFVIRRIRNLP